MLKTVGIPSVRFGNQTINSGNLVIGTAGNGIDFSAAASAPGMTSELLDDYEEGTWTPGVTALGISGVTYSEQTGRYVKVGDMVLAGFLVTLNALTSGGTNSLRVTGLPFTSGAGTFTAAIYSANTTGGVSGNYVVGYLAPGNSEMNFFEIGPNGSIAATGMSGARLTATSSFAAAICYRV